MYMYNDGLSLTIGDFITHHDNCGVLVTSLVMYSFPVRENFPPVIMCDRTNVAALDVSYYKKVRRDRGGYC